MRAHVIENGIVANTIKVDALDQFPGMTLIDADLHPGAPGDLWNGSALSSPTKSLADLKTEKKQEVTATYRKKSELPVNVGGVLISAYDGPLMELIGAKVGSKAQRKFVTALGQKVSVTQAELNALFAAVDDHKQLLRDREYDLYDAIDAAADLTALNAIDISAGWPI